MENLKTDAPKLEAPGKGLPFLEGLVARYYYGAYLSKKDSPEKNFRRFEKINLKILELIKNLNNEQIHKKILVPRLRGIEDSSRFWSVADTLEHIEIVGESITMVLEKLAKGEVPAGVARVADYKPKGKYAFTDPRPEFESFSKKTLEKLKPLKFSLDSPKFLHPWLGNFSSLQWQWILSTHSGLHLNQIMHILPKL